MQTILKITVFIATIIAFIFMFYAILGNVAEASYFDWYDSFEFYNATDINGQGNWTATADNTVTTATSSVGTKSLEIQSTGSGTIILDTQSNLELQGDNVIFSFDVNHSTLNTSGLYIAENASTYAGNFYQTGGNFAIQNGIGGSATCLAGVSSTVWYDIDLQFDWTNDQFRCRVDSGTWSSYVAFKDTDFTADQIIITKPAFNEAYYDNFNITNTATSFATSTQIISINSPTNDSTTGSTEVTFDFDYWYTGDGNDYTYVGIDIQNLSNYEIIVTDTLPILSSGESSFSDSYILNSGDFYGWRPYIGGDGSFVYGNWSYFWVVSSGAGQTLIDTGDDNIGSSTTAFGNVASFFQRTAPFSYINDGLRLWDEFGSFSTTSTSTTLLLPFDGNWKGVATTVPVNLVTVSEFSPVEYMRTILSYIIYFMVGAWTVFAVTKLF